MNQGSASHRDHRPYLAPTLANTLLIVMDQPTKAVSRRQGLILAGATAVISGFAVFVNGYGVRAWIEVSDATTYTTLKNGFAAFVLIGVFLAARRRSSFHRWRPHRPKHWVGVATVAVIGGAVPFVLFFEGLARAQSVQAAFLHKTLVVWVAVLAVVFLKERVGALQIGAIALLIVGQLVIFGGVEGFAFGAGEVMILAATLMWSVEVVMAKWLLSEVPSHTLAVVRMAGGAVALILIGLAAGGLLSISGATWGHFGWIALTGLFLAGYVGTWYAALSRAPAVDVTAILVGGAVITALLRAVVAGAPISSPIGLALVSAGVLAACIAAGKRRTPLPTAL